ncbi:hypothetical protein GVN24_22675 [Rhizobium sp. CRIBSB]|nr:hypothetical protein [Rhizobium sp. CRIBSB]
MNGMRAFWLKQLHQWHWISASISLVGMLLFSITGITLNHAAEIPSEPVTVQATATLPSPLLERLKQFPQETTDPVPDAVARWASAELKAPVAGRPSETTADEVYVALQMPGGDGWLTIDRETGEAIRETTTNGPVAWLNDLHKGRNTGAVWFWLIDIFAVAFIIFAVTGLALLWLHARNRKSTWPLVFAGLLIPAVVVLIFVH